METKRYGLLIEPIDIASDFLGGTSLSLEAKFGAEVINPEGDWSQYTPSTEDQDTSTGDTYACVSYATTNAIEMIARARFQNLNNLSDRYLAKMSGTVLGQGNSPKRVAEQLRKGWTVNEPEWPDTHTTSEYYADIPEHLKTLAVARGAEFDFGWQYIANTTAQIRTALKHSPVCIAVTAWKEENGVYVRVPGIQENHWTTLIAILPNGNYKVFDSFFPFEKEVHPSAAQSVAMSYYLNRQVVKESLWKKFLKWIAAWRKEEEAKPTVPSQVPPAPVSQPSTPVSQPNTNDKLIAALIQVESEGNDNAIGDKNLANKAYGCLQIRKPYVDDVNAYLGTNYKAQDCLGNRELSIKIARAYFKRYKLTTDEQKARAHNGGASAARPGTKMHAATHAYWAKVKKLL